MKIICSKIFYNEINLNEHFPDYGSQILFCQSFAPYSNSENSMKGYDKMAYSSKNSKHACIVIAMLKNYVAKKFELFLLGKLLTKQYIAM